jgi:hypothetical protein
MRIKLVKTFSTMYEKKKCYRQFDQVSPEIFL